MSESMHDEGMSPAGLTPPTDAQVLDEAEFGGLVGWPKVVGIISIVWASLGLLGGVCGAIALVVLPTFMAKQPGFDPNNMPPSMVVGPLKLVLFAAGFGLSGLLMFAGIATARRRDLGRLTHLAYAAFSLLFLVLQVYVQLTDANAMEAWIRDNPNNPVAKGGTGGMYIGLVVSVVLGVLWPAFLFIWFGAMKTKPGAMKEFKKGDVG